jgi:nicotinamidase-related amidase
VRLSSGAVLLLIDVQQGLDDPRWGARNNPEAEQRIAELLAAWRATGRPVIHFQHGGVTHPPDGYPADGPFSAAR